MLSAIILKIFVITLSIQFVQLKVKQLYEREADDFVESIIGDIYKARTLLDQITTAATNNRNIDAKTNRNARKYFAKTKRTPIVEDDKADNGLQNTSATHLANSSTPKQKPYNLTMEQIKMRRITRYVHRVINDNSSMIPNFEDNDDDPSMQTRRFDSARRVATKFIVLDVLNQFAIAKKMKIIALMQQFVYGIRYMLPVAQRLRKKYRDSYYYRIGFCYCTFRMIFFHMRRLSSTMVFYLKKFKSVLVHMKIYERIVRLYVDVKDLVKNMKKMEYLKNMLIDPKFYDISLMTYESDVG